MRFGHQISWLNQKKILKGGSFFSLSAGFDVELDLKNHQKISFWIGHRQIMIPVYTLPY